MQQESECRTVVFRDAVYSPTQCVTVTGARPFDLCVLVRYTYTRRFRVSSPVAVFAIAVFTTLGGTVGSLVDWTSKLDPRDRHSPVARARMTTRSWRCATPRNMPCRNIPSIDTGIPRCWADSRSMGHGWNRTAKSNGSHGFVYWPLCRWYTYLHRGRPHCSQCRALY